MPDFSVSPPEIRTAGQCLADGADGLSGIRLTAPDPNMYGQLVGSAAADCEPATTEDINRLLQALTSGITALADRAERTCAAYEKAETANIAHARVVDTGSGTAR